MSLVPTLNVEESLSASPSSRKLVVFSGGSAANNLVDVFNEVIEKNSCSLAYVIPISDNGGSSSELIRVFGGPGIGDIRSQYILSLFMPGRLGRFILSCLQLCVPGFHDRVLSAKHFCFVW